jgi:hypothetical protein
MKEDRRGWGEKRSSDGTKERAARREGCAGIDRSPAQTTCWSNGSEDVRKEAIRQQGTEY